MEISNQQLAKIFRNVAAAYTIKKAGTLFQIRAYENAADAIESSNADIYDLWQEGRLSEVPGIGEKFQNYLNELFRKGKVRHFEAVEKGISPIVFDLLDITGIGPKTAQKIAELGVGDIEDLKKKIKSGELVAKGFSAKIAQKIMEGFQKVNITGQRMLLTYAFPQADKILSFIKQSPDVLQVHPLGSLRRMVATVGDLDFSVSSHNPKAVVEYFCKMPGVVRIIDKGTNKATVVLRNGLQADLLVGEPESYGALLQHFTGSKAHNIKLRELAIRKGLSLSEYGVRESKSKALKETKSEDEFYRLLSMQTPPPELREDTGEIEAALNHKLPDLVEFKDIRGDLHLHSNFPLKNPSHGPGVNTIEEIVKKADDLGYSYVGIADHAPGFTTSTREETIKWIKERTDYIKHLNSKNKSIRVLNGLEVDILPDGSLTIPDELLSLLNYCIVGIHAGHRDPSDIMTKRLIKALENPNVDILSHPTNRLLNERESSEADWDEVFKVAAENNKLLEINGYPNRLDLREDLVRKASAFGIKFIINTDSHQVPQMDNMRFGVSVARRGWVETKDVVNAWDWTEFAKWFNIT